MQHDIREKVHIPLERLMLSVQSSMQHDIEEEEEAHIPFNSLLLSIRNPMRCAMEEGACFLLESSLLSI
jgi:hypothetical protein